MEQKFNFKTLGVIMIWIGVLIGAIYVFPFKRILTSKDAGSRVSVNMMNTKLIAVEKEYDFGDISMAKGKVRHSYKLKNEGTDALKIEAVWTSCMCTVAEVKMADGKIYGPFGMSGHGSNNAKADVDIPAGQEIELIAEFDPNAHGPDATGPIQRTVFVKTNDAKDPLGLSFMADVTK